jgi:hypothetical protein
VLVVVVKEEEAAGCATGASGSISSTAEEKRTEAGPSRGLLLVLSFDGARARGAAVAAAAASGGAGAASVCSSDDAENQVSSGRGLGATLDSCLPISPTSQRGRRGRRLRRRSGCAGRVKEQESETHQQRPPAERTASGARTTPWIKDAGV